MAKFLKNEILMDLHIYRLLGLQSLMSVSVSLVVYIYVIEKKMALQKFPTFCYILPSKS